MNDDAEVILMFVRGLGEIEIVGEIFKFTIK